MSFDKSALEAYVKLNGKPFAQKAVKGATTAKLLIDARSVILGAKGDNQVPTIDVDANIQDGSVSGRNASGGTKFTDKVLKIARFKDQQNYNNDDLYDVYLVEYLAKGQNPENETLDTDIINTIIERRTNKIAAQMELVLWHGQKSGGVSPYDVAPFTLIDGILKQVAAGSPVSITASGADVVEKIQDAYVKFPVEVKRADDFRIFMGTDTYDEYCKVLANKNFFAQPGTDTLYGFPRAKFVVVEGLDGTDKIFMSRISNMKLGVDKVGDMTEASMKWSIETEQWYQDFNFATGILVVFVEETALVSVA